MLFIKMMFAHFDGGGTTVTRGHHPNALPLCTAVAVVQRPVKRLGRRVNVLRPGALPWWRLCHTGEDRVRGHLFFSVCCVCVGRAGERGGVSLNLLAQNNLTQTLVSRLAGRTVLVQYLSANKREQRFDSYSYSISGINRITFHSIT